jgi:hypothetical protein
MTTNTRLPAATTANLARALEYALVSPNEFDRNLEPANVVDALYALARAVHHLADALEQQR